MLGKLLKYEYKATSRYFIGLYIVLALLTIGNKFMLIIEDTSDVQLRVVDILFGIIMASYVIAIIAIAVATVVLMLRRFYFNMLKDEGYLTFTLPATVGQHIASKMIVCITWVIATVVLTGVSIFVVTYSKDIDYARGISYSVQKLTQLGAWGYVAEGIIAAIVTVIGMPILMYACLSIGQLYTKHRVVGAILAYIGYYIINQVVSSVFLVICMHSLGNSYDISAFANQIFIFGIVLSIVVSIASYIATYYILSKKLNLE